MAASIVVPPIADSLPPSQQPPRFSTPYRTESPLGFNMQTDSFAMRPFSRMSSSSLLEPIDENQVSMAPPSRGGRRPESTYETIDRHHGSSGTETFAAAAQSQGHRSFRDTMNQLDAPLPPRRELPFANRPGSAPQQRPVTVSSSSSDILAITHDSLLSNVTQATGKRPLTSNSFDNQTLTPKPKAPQRPQSIAVPASQCGVLSIPESNQTWTPFDFTPCATSVANDHQTSVSDISTSIKLSFNNLKGFANLSIVEKQNVEDEIMRTICEMPDDFIALCELIERALSVQLQLKHILNGRNVQTD
jgi:hypothetical protein